MGKGDIMELEASMADLQAKLREHREILATEEAAKTTLVLPFLRALGYDIFNPSEVKAEFTCDVGTKKGEKVDDALCVGSEVTFLSSASRSRVSFRSSMPASFSGISRLQQRGWRC